MKPPLLRITIVLLMAASLVRQADTAEAAAEPVSLSVRPGFAGLARVGAWLPVELLVANNGPALEGELELQVDGTQERSSLGSPPVVQSVPAVLPRYSEKRFLLSAYVPRANSRVTARLRVNGDALVERDVPVNVVPPGELLCGVLSRDPSALEFLTAIPLAARQRSVRLAKLAVGDLPAQAQLLASLDCLIVSNPPPGALGERQLSALRTWVAEGGLLIVSGGSNWQQPLLEAAPDLLPVKVTGTQAVPSLPSLADFARQPIADPGPWLVARAEPVGGTTVVQEGDLPLLVMGRFGNGGIAYLALDPAAEPLRSWRGSEFLWRYILSNVPAAVASPSAPSRQYSGWGRVPRQALADVKEAGLPNGRALALFVFGYAVALAPLSYLGIRRARMPGRTAILLVMVVSLATTASLGIAQAGRDADVIVNEITLIRAWDERAAASTHTYVGLLSEAATEFDLAAPSSSLVHGLLNPFAGNSGREVAAWLLKVENGEAPLLRGLALPAGSLASLVVDDAAPAVPVAAALDLAAGRLSGTIANRSQRVLGDAALVVGGRIVSLGTLAPGESRAVSVDFAAPTPAGYPTAGDVVDGLVAGDDASPRQVTRRDILDAALDVSYEYFARVELSAVSLVAWLDGGATSLETRGAKKAEIERTLLVTTLPVRIGAGEAVVIPPELIERRPLAVNVGSKLENRSLSLAVGESASTEYLLPAHRGQFAVDSLALQVEGTLIDQPSVPPGVLGSAFVFDWRAADWTEVRLGFGKNELADPQRFVSPLGTIRVRYTFRPPAGSDYTRLELSAFDVLVGGHSL